MPFRALRRHQSPGEFLTGSINVTFGTPIFSRTSNPYHLFDLAVQTRASGDYNISVATDNSLR